MTVSFQSYNTPTTWTPDDARGMFRTAFIDAGILPGSGWFDSFDNGNLRHAVVRIQHDATKTYGTTFYWFIFSPGQIHVHFCTSGWSTTTDLPTGASEALDNPFWGTPVNNSVDRHHRWMTAAPNVTLQLVRYTSSVDPTFTVFVLKNGTQEIPFFLHRGAPSAAFCDLDRVCYMGLYNIVQNYNASNGVTVSFEAFPLWIRRYFLGGMMPGLVSASLNNTSNFSFFAHNPGSGNNVSNLPCDGTRRGISYFWPCIGKTFSPNGNERVPGAGNVVGSTAVRVPIFNSTVNPMVTGGSPIFTGIPYTLYSPQVIPVDFGWAAAYNNNTMNTFDRYIVATGTNEWEILQVVNRSRGSGLDEPSVMFLARRT